MKMRISKRMLSLLLTLVMVLGMLPHFALEAEAATSNSVTINGLTYTVSVKSATDRKGNNAMSEIEAVNFYGDETRNGNTVKITGINLQGFIGNATVSFTDSNCAETLSVERTVQSGNDKVGYSTAVLSITRSAASHTGGTCTNPVCSRCKKTYDAPHDYKWKNDGTNHWQECTRDASHKTSHGTCSGGTAYCQQQAVCSTCQNPYGSTNPDNHKWGAWGYAGSEGDCRTCTLCGTEEKFRDHVYLTPPTCTQSEQCQLCKWYFIDRDNHNWSTAWSYNDTQHWQVCTRDSSHTQKRANHSGGDATCTTAGTCTTCGASYKNPNAHNLTYTSTSANTITETCSYGCDHSATAKLEYDTGNGTYTYTGSEIKPLKVSYSDGWKGGSLYISYSRDIINVGEAMGVITATTQTNVIASLIYKITAKTLTSDMVTLSPASGTYTGAAVTQPTVTVADGTAMTANDYTVTWPDGADWTNAGTITVTVKGQNNYAGTVTKNFVIGKATPTPELFQFELPQNAIYDGNTRYSANVTSNASGLGEFTVKYNGSETAPVNAGTYTVTVDVAEGSNYNAASGIELGSFTIDPRDASITIPAGQTVTYDGAELTAGTSNADILYTYNGDSTPVVKWYADNEGVKGELLTHPPIYAGTYWIGVSAPAGNFKAVEEVTASVTIDKADPGIGKVTAGVVEDTLDTSAIDLTRENLSVDGMLTVDAGQTLALGENTIRYTFFPTDTENYKTVTGTVTVTVVDTIPPEGTVTISTNSWNQFLNDITFGLFFKETQEVSVSASDNLSDVDKIEYIESATAMDQDAVKAAQQWTEMNNGSVSVTLEDTKQFIYYIRITDKSGNVAYLSTDGAEYDTTAPVIEGVVSGATCYTTQTVTVTDKNIDAITLNGEAATSPITLEGNKEAAYTIVATDKAGNSTTVTVTMKPIQALAEATNDLTNDNVTSANTPALEALVEKLDELLADDDLTAGEQETLEQHKAIAESLIQTIEDTAAEQEAVTDKAAQFDEETVKSTDKEELEALAEDIEALLDTDNLTQDERTALEGTKADVEAMLDAIEEAAKAADTENTAKVEDVTAENVTPGDKSDLENAKADLEKALEDNGGNYTEEEKQAIEDNIARIGEALQIVENVEAVEGAISDLPATVEPDDEETVAKIEEAKTAYDALTEYEKSLVDEATKKKLDDLTAAAVAYKIVKGDGSKWTKGGTSGLSFTANGPLSKFSGVEIDGKVLDAKNYDAAAGSTVVTLEASYLETLSVGAHTITVVYTDGEAEGTFEISPKPVTPATGDNSNIMLYGAMFTMSLAALAVLLLAFRKRKQAN